MPMIRAKVEQPVRIIKRSGDMIFTNADWEILLLQHGGWTKVPTRA